MKTKLEGHENFPYMWQVVTVRHSHVDCHHYFLAYFYSEFSDFFWEYWTNSFQFQVTKTIHSAVALWDGFLKIPWFIWKLFILRLHYFKLRDFSEDFPFLFKKTNSCHLHFFINPKLWVCTRIIFFFTGMRIEIKKINSSVNRLHQ